MSDIQANVEETDVSWVQYTCHPTASKSFEPVKCKDIKNIQTHDLAVGQNQTDRLPKRHEVVRCVMDLREVMFDPVVA